MTDEQPDFSALFYETFGSSKDPVKYRIRDNSNLLHDLVFVSSLIHDARVLNPNTPVQDGVVDIHLNRDCWELDYTDDGKSLELHIADSILKCTGVKSIDWSVDRQPEADPWINHLWIDPAYRDSDAPHFDFFLVGEQWKCTIVLIQLEWAIELSDQETPYPWSSRHSE